MLDTTNIWFEGFSFIMFSDVLPAFICASAISNLLNIYLGVNVLRLLLWICCPIGNILLSKPLRTFCFFLRNLIALSKFIAFFLFLSWVFGVIDSLNLLFWFFTFTCYLSASFSIKLPLYISHVKDHIVLNFLEFMCYSFSYQHFYKLNHYWFFVLSL